MTLADSFRLLTPEQQRNVHLLLCEEALRIWDAYAARHAPIVYYDSVVGMRHQVDVGLAHDALRSARLGTDVEGIQERYLEPTVAMQDDDLVFPKTIEFAYYAIYNCFCKHACGDDVDPWLIVNQAISADDNEAAWSQRLTAAIAAST
jgi:hypothetical protein